VHAESGRTGRIRLDQYFSVATQIPPADILKFRSLRVVAQRRVTKILCTLCGAPPTHRCQRFARSRCCAGVLGCAEACNGIHANLLNYNAIILMLREFIVDRSPAQPRPPPPTISNLRAMLKLRFRACGFLRDPVGPKNWNGGRSFELAGVPGVATTGSKAAFPTSSISQSQRRIAEAETPDRRHARRMVTAIADSPTVSRISRVISA
jgi:hypothetical protein